MRPVLFIPGAVLALAAAPAGDRDAAAIDAALKGLVAGAPQQCITEFERQSSQRFGDTVLFRVRRTLVYRSQLTPGCGSDDDILVTQSTGTGLCAGQIIRTVSRLASIDTGSCVWGKFIPYRKP